MRARHFAAMALLLTGPALAQAPPTVDHAWTRATPSNAQTAAVYLVIHASVADRLTRVSTPAATGAMLHRSMDDGGIMEMRPLDGVDLPPGEDVALAPAGTHVMLIGLQHPLRQGDHFPLTLVFSHAPALTVDVTVERGNATGPTLRP